MSVEFGSGKKLRLVVEMVNNEVKGWLRYAKQGMQNELYTKTYILIELNKNATVKQSNVNTNIEIVINLSRYSSFKKLINVTCFVFRSLKNLPCKLKKQNQCFKKELVGVCRGAQRIKYKEDCLRWQPNFQNLFSSLILFEDSQNILRLKGIRLEYNQKYHVIDQKYPILLRVYESLFIRLLIFDMHHKSLHKGIEFTLNRVRSKFWICQERKSVKRVFRNCVVCKRYHARPVLLPLSLDITDFRINISSYSFLFVGLDFAGFLLVKSGKKYSFLFTRASSHAIHFKFIPGMSNPSFIWAVKRFVSIRGMADQVIRDNFKSFNSVEVKNYFVKHSVKQSFILPASPLWAGFYERLVQSVKSTLHKTLGKLFLTFEEMQTILCEIEYLIKCRPLVYTRVLTRIYINSVTFVVWKKFNWS